MDTGDFAAAIEQKVSLQRQAVQGRIAIPLEKEEIGELWRRAKADWREVEPAIFGTLWSRRLTRRSAPVGAHYTPRAYVERLVVVTVIEPLRQEWARVQATAERLKEEGREAEAIASVRTFLQAPLQHARLGPCLRHRQLSLCRARTDEAA